MLRRVGAFGILIAISAQFASAAGPELPAIMAGPDNAVPACVTPGRLMAFLKQRNPELNPRYDAIATQYMRFGEQLGVRWDYAFYQMVVETGALSYWRGKRAGDVRPDQNNFAGLGATGGGEHGESFKDIESGVRAHLEHVLLYAGHPVANPVAERTRKVHEWGILNAWQQSFRRPITYTDLAAKWAPGSRHYVSMMQTVADRFQADVCRTPDPRPQLVQEARALAGKDTGAATAAASAPAKTADAAPSSVLAIGAELVQRVFEPKAEKEQGRSALGAPQPPAEPAAPAAPSAPYKVLDPAPPAAAQQEPAATPIGTASAGTTSAAPASYDADANAGAKAGAKSAAAQKSGAGERTGDKAGDRGAGSTRFALAGAAATGVAKLKPAPEAAVPPPANQKCRVWTASYGGQKSIIIRSVADQVVNFTVLDVNAGSAAREAEAFIAAYAKNGKIAAEYPNQAQALDKAFELCPEG
jgi:hypothetical protein